MGGGLPSRQTVNAVDGRVRARNVAVGDRLWTLESSSSTRSVVSSVTVRKERELVTPLPLDEREWVRVRAVRPRRASGAAKPFTLYGFRLQPHRHFLVNGHLCGAV